MKKTQWFIILVVLFIFSLYITWLIVPKEQTIVYNVSVAVGSVTSLNPTPDLNFGELKPGESATKSISFNNFFFSNVQLDIITEGEITDWLSVEERMNIFPFSGKKLEITLSIPNDAQKRTFQGNIKIKTRRYFIWK